MNKIKLALVAAIGFLFFACGSKTDVDFSIIPVKGSNGLYQYIDMKQKGKIVINPQFSEAHYFRDGLAVVKTSGNDGKWGYIDKEGKFVIAPLYSMAQHFSEAVAWVQIEDQPPMLIDKKGKMLLQVDPFAETFPFHNGMSGIGIYNQEQEFYKFIDKKGETVATIMGDVTINPFLSSGLYALQNKETKKWGFRNINGETIINEIFDDANMFIDRIAVVRVGEKYGAIDKEGNFIINPQYDSLFYDSDGLFVAQVNKKYGWVNKKNEIFINPQYDEADRFAGNKLAPVKMGSKWAYIDKKGQVVINPQFDNAASFSGSYAMIISSSKSGFIDSKGDFIVPPLYDADSKNYEEYTYAVIQKSYGFLPVSSGKFLTDERDGKKYKIAKIGELVWMAENLNFNAKDSKCYNDDIENCKKYGRFYDRKSAMLACPKGWHLPSDAEWQYLVETVGGEEIAGKHLKAKTGWNEYKGKSGNGLDTYGFEALPGNHREGNKNFCNVGNCGSWWSTGTGSKSYGWYNYYTTFYSFYMRHDDDLVHLSDEGESHGCSVRCVKDLTQAEITKMIAVEAAKKVND